MCHASPPERLLRAPVQVNQDVNPPFLLSLDFLEQENAELVSDTQSRISGLYTEHSLYPVAHPLVAVARL